MVPGTPGKTDARRKVVPIRLHQRFAGQTGVFGFDHINIAERHERAYLRERAVGHDDLAAVNIEDGEQTIGFVPVRVEVITYAEIERQARSDLEVIGGEEFVAATTAIAQQSRKGARHGRGQAEQEVSVRVARGFVGEAQIAKQVVTLLPVLRLVAAYLKTGLERMPPVIPVEVLLPLVGEVLEAGNPHGGLRDAGDAQARKADVGHAVDVGQVADQADQSQRIDDLASTQRPLARVVAERKSPARLADQRGSYGVSKSDSCRPRVTHAIELADGRQIGFKGAVERAVPGVSAKDKCFLRKAMINPRRPISVGIEGPALLFEVIICRELTGIGGVGQWPEATLNC